MVIQVVDWTLFSSAFKTISAVVSLQKRAIRIISKSTFDSHSDPMFKELELLKLFDIRQLELGKLVFSFNHSLLPPKCNNYFSLTNKSIAMQLETPMIFAFLFAELTFGNFLSVSKDQLIITL